MSGAHRLRAATVTARRRWTTRGTARWCPICERSSGTFLPYGSHQRQDVMCPQCGSGDRHRLIWIYLTKHTSMLQQNPRVLHMAPEKALTEKLRPRAGSYVTLDLYAEGVDIQADVTKPIPLPDQSFDIILCSHILEHVGDDRAAMRELVRLTAPDGVCLVMTPISSSPTIEDPSETDPEELARRFGQRDHVRLYGLDLVDRLTQEGFEVDPFVVAERFDAGEMERMRLHPAHRLFVCRRPASA